MTTDRAKRAPSRTDGIKLPRFGCPPCRRGIVRIIALAALVASLSCSGAQTRFTGCMAGEKKRAEQSGYDAPSYFVDETAPGPTAGTERKGVRALLTPRNGELAVHAYFGHACCRKGDLVKRVKKGAKGEASLLELEIRLSGRTCRCRCFSGMVSVLSLKPGSYRVILRLEGEEKPVLDESVVIPK